jgi:putative two-component system response regulator
MWTNVPLLTRDSGTGNILIVEDDRQIGMLLVRQLEREGHRVAIVTEGELALDVVARDQPDLILADVRLPGINGFELCQRIKGAIATALTPVVLMTGGGAEDDRLRGIEAGADDFVTKPYDLAELRARVKSLLRLKQYTDELESAESVIRSLALTVEARDAYTHGHCDRLADYAGMLGAACGCSTDELKALRLGGYLHDIGKIAVPDSVLQKAGRLTPDEFDIIKRHPVVGERLCGSLRSLSLVRPIVRHHHELLDGSGYPDSLRGGEIPLLAQIIGVVDVYDALTTDRPYRRALTSLEAFAELRNDVARGTRSGVLVRAFIDARSRAGCQRLETAPNRRPAPRPNR